MTDDLQFKRGTATPDRIEAYSRQIWEELKDAGDLPNGLGAEPEFPYAFGISGSGFVLEGTAIVIGISSLHLGEVAKTVALDLWKDVIRPRIRRRWGEDAIGRKKPGKTDRDTADGTKAKPKKNRKNKKSKS